LLHRLIGSCSCASASRRGGSPLGGVRTLIPALPRPEGSLWTKAGARCAASPTPPATHGLFPCPVFAQAVVGRSPHPASNGTSRKYNTNSFAEGARGSLTNQLIAKFALDKEHEEDPVLQFGISSQGSLADRPTKHSKVLSSHFRFGWPLQTIPPRGGRGVARPYHYDYNNLVSVALSCSHLRRPLICRQFEERRMPRLQTHPVRRPAIRQTLFEGRAASARLLYGGARHHRTPRSYHSGSAALFCRRSSDRRPALIGSSGLLLQSCRGASRVCITPWARLMLWRRTRRRVARWPFRAAGATTVCDYRTPCGLGPGFCRGTWQYQSRKRGPIRYCSRFAKSHRRAWPSFSVSTMWCNPAWLSLLFWFGRGTLSACQALPQEDARSPRHDGAQPSASAEADCKLTFYKLELSCGVPLHLSDTNHEEGPAVSISRSRIWAAKKELRNSEQRCY